MRAARLCLAGIIVTCVVLVAGSARAGGAMWQLNGRAYYEIAFSPGDVVEASTGVWLKGPGLGRVEDGPYFGYLFEGRDAVFPPPVPDDAMLLGEVTIDAHDATDSHSVARFSFTVPDVQPGRYWLLHCNDPCTTSLGDIVTTPITIVAGPGEEQLVVDLGRLERRFEERSFILGRDVRRVRGKLTAEIARVERRIDDLGTRVERLLAEGESLRDAPPGLVEGSVGAGAVLAAAGLLWAARRRR